MNEQLGPKTITRTAIGLTLIVTSFIWMTYFLFYAPLPSPNTFLAKITIWSAIMIACLLFFYGFCISLGIEMKKMIAGSLFLLVWSLGFVTIPVPEGYGEAVLGSWAILGMIIVAFYFQHEKLMKKKLHKEGNKR